MATDAAEGCRMLGIGSLLGVRWGGLYRSGEFGSAAMGSATSVAADCVDCINCIACSISAPRGPAAAAAAGCGAGWTADITIKHQISRDAIFSENASSGLPKVVSCGGV